LFSRTGDVMRRCAAVPTASMAITDATPMITPRAVSAARVRFRHNARTASRNPSSHAIATASEQYDAG
jgi:hypothetical protein